MDIVSIEVFYQNITKLAKSTFYNQLPHCKQSVIILGIVLLSVDSFRQMVAVVAKILIRTKTELKTQQLTRLKQQHKSQALTKNILALLCVSEWHFPQTVKPMNVQ